MQLEIEKGLREKADTGGGCIYITLSEWADRFEMNEAQVLRELADLLDADKIKNPTVEICA